jgi:hypothetical protein
MRNLKKLVSLSLVLVMLFAFGAAAMAKPLGEYADYATAAQLSAEADARNPDMPRRHYLQAQQLLSDLGAYGAGDLMPGKEITRGEFFTMIYRVVTSGGLGSQMEDQLRNSGYFADTKPGDWWAPFANWAGINGFTSGTSAGAVKTFDVNGTMSYWDVIQAIVRQLGFDNAYERITGYTISDQMQVAWLASDLFGLNYQVSNMQKMTRGDVAVLLAQMMNANPIEGYRVNFQAGDGSYVRSHDDNFTYGWKKFQLQTFTGVVHLTKYGDLLGSLDTSYLRGAYYNAAIKNFDALLIDDNGRGVLADLDDLTELEIAQALGKEYTMTLRLATATAWDTVGGDKTDTIARIYGTPSLTANNEVTEVKLTKDGVFAGSTEIHPITADDAYITLNGGMLGEINTAVLPIVNNNGGAYNNKGFVDSTWVYYGNRAYDIIGTASQIVKIADADTAANNTLNFRLAAQTMAPTSAVDRFSLGLTTGNILRTKALSTIPAKDAVVAITPYNMTGGMSFTATDNFYAIQSLEDFATTVVTGAVTRVTGSTREAAVATIDGKTYARSAMTDTNDAVPNLGQLAASTSYYVDAFGKIIFRTVAAAAPKYVYGLVTDSYFRASAASDPLSGSGSAEQISRVSFLNAAGTKLSFDSVSVGNGKVEDSGIARSTLANGRAGNFVAALMPGTLVAYVEPAEGATSIVLYVVDGNGAADASPSAADGTLATGTVTYATGTRSSITMSPKGSALLNSSSVIFVRSGLDTWHTFNRSSMVATGLTAINTGRYVLGQTIAANDTIVAAYIDVTSKTGSISLPVTTVGKAGVIKSSSLIDRSGTSVLEVLLWTKDGLETITTSGAANVEDLKEFIIGRAIHNLQVDGNSRASLDAFKAALRTPSAINGAALDDQYYAANVAKNEGGYIVNLVNQSKGGAYQIYDVLAADAFVYIINEDDTVTKGTLADLKTYGETDKTTVVYMVDTTENPDHHTFWYRAAGLYKPQSGDQTPAQIADALEDIWAFDGTGEDTDNEGLGDPSDWQIGDYDYPTTYTNTQAGETAFKAAVLAAAQAYVATLDADVTVAVADDGDWDVISGPSTTTTVMFTLEKAGVTFKTTTITVSVPAAPADPFTAELARFAGFNEAAVLTAIKPADGDYFTDSATAKAAILADAVLTPGTNGLTPSTALSPTFTYEYSFFAETWAAGNSVTVVLTIYKDKGLQTEATKVVEEIVTLPAVTAAQLNAEFALINADKGVFLDYTTDYFTDGAASLGLLETAIEGVALTGGYTADVTTVAGDVTGWSGGDEVDVAVTIEHTASGCYKEYLVEDIQLTIEEAGFDAIIALVEAVEITGTPVPEYASAENAEDAIATLVEAESTAEFTVVFVDSTIAAGNSGAAIENITIDYTITHEPSGTIMEVTGADIADIPIAG